MSSNKTIYCQIIEPYVNYGLEHFKKKYGFKVTDNYLNADIYIGYSIPDNCNSSIQVLLFPTVLDKICHLTVQNETIPLLKKPIKQRGDNLWGSVTDENETYFCIQLVKNRIIFGFDIFEEIGRILAGKYDELFLLKDEVGEKLKNIPVVDVLEKALLSMFNLILPDTNNLYHFTWPDNHKFALILTHDVDRVYKTYQYLPSIINSIKKGKLSELSYHVKNLFFKHGQLNPYWTFETIDELEYSLGVKSSYYFLNEKGRLNPLSLQSWILFRGIYNIENSSIKNLINKLDRAGFEIGLHGSYYSFDNFELLKYEKNILEMIVNKKVSGIRQHYLNYKISVTPNIHHKVGFDYDTTIGFKPDDGVGFRRGTCFPFRIMLPDLRISNLWEFPLIIMDGALDAKATIEDCVQLIDQVEKYHGVLTILWHTNRFNNREYPTMINIYKEIIQIAKSKDAWNSTAHEICSWLNK